MHPTGQGAKSEHIVEYVSPLEEGPASALTGRSALREAQGVCPEGVDDSTSLTVDPERAERVEGRRPNVQIYCTHHTRDLGTEIRHRESARPDTGGL